MSIFYSNKLINLPKILLVHGDVILLRPSKRTPCRVRTLFSSLQPQVLFEYEKDEVFLPDQWETEERFKRVAVKPFQSIYCEVQETPAVDYLKNCLDAGCRPMSVFENELHRAIHILLERYVIPILLLAYFLVVLFRCLVFPKLTFPLLFATLLVPARLLIPVCGILIPCLTLFINMYGLSKVLCQVDSNTGTSAVGLDKSDNWKISKSCLDNKTDSLELFTESTETANSPISQNFSFPRCRRLFWSLLRGNPKYLPLSSNLVHCLGNATSLDVVDKKGILSWPNAVPEKVFFFAPTASGAKPGRPTTLTPRTLSCKSDSSFETNEHDPNAADSYSSQIPMNSGGISEQVLDFTHEPDQTFAIMFDDPKWKAFLSNLKPIGLNVLLNGCKLNEYYMRFLDHLGVVSNFVPRTLAVSNRRCLCSLAKIIGFEEKILQQFREIGHFGAYRCAEGDIPLPGFTQLKSPLANVVCSQWQDLFTGYYQLFTQGTADLLIDSCAGVWDGREVTKLSKVLRRKVADFYHRFSMTTYCLALSYRPMKLPLGPGVSNHYLEVPTTENWRKRNKLIQNRKFSSLALSADSLLSDIYNEDLTSDVKDLKKIESLDECLDSAMNEQVFLGLISLQYQAKPDVM